MYRFHERIDHVQFFRFDKRWIESLNWARLPKSSKSILPVIGIHCNGKGLSFPGETTIAIFAGLTEKTVREGLQGLKGFPGFEISHCTTENGRRAKKYRLALPPKNEKGRSFFFHRCIMEGGNWRELKPISHALYPVMRYFAKFDEFTYLEGEPEAEHAPTDEEFKDLFKDRKWDVCETGISNLAKFAGISRPSVYEALKDLEKHWLIESLGRNYEGWLTWKVFLRPKRYYSREYLNNQVAKKNKRRAKSVCKKITGHV
jgi:hypothetical protein